MRTREKKTLQAAARRSTKAELVQKLAATNHELRDAEDLLASKSASLTAMIAQRAQQDAILEQLQTTNNTLVEECNRRADDLGVARKELTGSCNDRDRYREERNNARAALEALALANGRLTNLRGHAIHAHGSNTAKHAEPWTPS